VKTPLRFAARFLPTRLAAPFLYLPHFLRFHRRLPKKPGKPGAGFEDLIAAQILHPQTALWGPYVDKEKAKELAKALAPEILVSKTFAVFRLGPRTTRRDLEKFLSPHWGEKRMAKPTHGSGSPLLLDRANPEDLEKLFQNARRDYFYQVGEAQYRGLERKIVVEESLAPRGGAPPADYRFHCAGGVPFYGAADVGRFLDLREHHFTVPNYFPVFLQAQGKKPSSPPAQPPRFKEMLAFAAKLSKPFDYVRVDLYQTPKGVYFGEFTFTPMAGLFKFLDPEFSKWLLARALEPEKKRALPKKWRGLRRPESGATSNCPTGPRGSSTGP
jgi:hypothetical protein